MSQKKSPAPVFVRTYPPFAMAMGTSFLSWLFGSLTYDSIFGKVPDTLLVFLFGLVFLGVLATALYAWTDIAALKKTGLHMNETGIRHVTAGIFRIKSRSLSWETVSTIELEEKGALVFQTGKEPLRVDTSSLLENPQWMLERAKTLHNAAAGNTAPAEEPQTELESAVCLSCGSGMDIQLGTPAAGEEIKCPYCGDTQGLPGKVKDALKRFSALIADLPAAHRQFQEKALRGFITEGRKHRRRLIGVGWGTAAVWLLFALVEIISTMAREETVGINVAFVGVTAGLAILSIVTAYLLVHFIKRAAGTFSLPMQALAATVSGGPARCRLCGGNLPEMGIVRRCSYCGSDSVVVGNQLAAAERSAKEALRQARDSVRQSTEAAARLLDNAATKMEIFTYTQFFWFHIPILVALDGSTGMLIKVTGTCLAMLVGNFASTIMGLRRLKKKG